MNTQNKIGLSILGACNIVMELFIPIAIALLLINTYNLEGYNSFILLVVSILAIVFRGVKIWI